MPFLVKLESPDGEVFYGSCPDSEGLRNRIHTTEQAERFITSDAAERAVREFKQIRELQNYDYEVVEV